MLSKLHIKNCNDLTSVVCNANRLIIQFCDFLTDIHNTNPSYYLELCSCDNYQNIEELQNIYQVELSYYSFDIPKFTVFTKCVTLRNCSLIQHISDLNLISLQIIDCPNLISISDCNIVNLEIKRCNSLSRLSKLYIWDTLTIKNCISISMFI